MATWKFSDQYGQDYPNIKSSLLNLLPFSKHNLDGDNFTGTIDLSEAGPIFSVLSFFLGISSIDVSGTITASDKLNIVLKTVDAQSPTNPIAKAIADKVVFLKKLLNGAYLDLQTTVTKSADDSPQDVFDIAVSIKLGSVELDITSAIPIRNGFIFIKVEPKIGDHNISLKDLGGFFGDSKGNWTDGFPQIFKDLNEFQLLEVSTSIYINKDQKKVAVSSATVRLGVPDLTITDNIWFHPLGIWVTLLNPGSGTSTDFGIEGDLMIGQNHSQADFDFFFSMDISTLELYGRLNPVDEPKPVALLLKDVIQTDLGMGETLKIDTFGFNAAYDKTAKKFNTYGFDIAMSGGFGLFKELDVESFTLTFDHTADTAADAN